MARALDDYVEVNERIQHFYERFPDGSLQRLGEPQIFSLDGKTFIAYTAAAYRTADDARPAMGTAWEPVPGPTSFTRDSELMNAETAAWGRAIAALGFEVKRGIASRQEVEARQAAPSPPTSAPPGMDPTTAEVQPEPEPPPASTGGTSEAQATAGPPGATLARVPGDTILPGEAERLRERLRIAGMNVGEVRMRLIALGVEDVAEPSDAIAALTVGQGTQLLQAIEEFESGR